MRITKTRHPLLMISIIALAAAGAGVLFFVLWREYLLLAIAASALLLSGASLLPERNVYLHGLSIGLCLGAFIGGAVGAVKYFAPEATATSSQTLDTTRVGISSAVTQATYS